MSATIEPGGVDAIEQRDRDLLTEIGVLQSELEEIYGHPPRILHIGNVANNAYNNAKIFNRLGFNCDVLCNDYYHIMGCPEWEDADFSGDVGNHFRPNWHVAGVGAYQRPRWFAQGAFRTCVDYLCASHRHPVWADELWNQLAAENHSLEHGKREHEISIAERLVATRLVIRALGYEMLRYLRAMSTPEVVERHFSLWCNRLSEDFLAGRVYRTTRAILAGVAHAVQFCRLSIVRHFTSSKLIVHRIHELKETLRSLIPEAQTSIRAGDLLPFSAGLRHWKRLFAHYDIVQGYATAPIYPYLLGQEYFAFEHGTLREIPFEETAQGRLTALAYNGAIHTFVTNSDCMENAHRLSGNRITFINHPYDEDHGLDVRGAEAMRDDLKASLDADFLFFYPTRHDWVPGTGYADKGNDVFLRAFGELRDAGHRVGMVCCRWGQNVTHSERLLAELGCASHVAWREPVGMIVFDRLCKAVDVVVDQFKLGSFGGVAFKALAVAAPVLTYLDVPEVLRQYPEPPPVINCRTTEDVVMEVSGLLAERGKLGELSRKSRSWIKTHHNSLETVLHQLRAYVNHARTLDVITPNRERRA